MGILRVKYLIGHAIFIIIIFIIIIIIIIIKVHIST